MKYALVTGGSRGIGRAVCCRLADMGYCVLINYVAHAAEAERTLEMIRQAGHDGELLCFDVADAGQTRLALENWQAKHPDEYIEVLVNNAGLRRDNFLALMPPEDWHRVIDVSLNGFFNVTQPLLQNMMFHRYGRIINMASVSGLSGIPGQTNYAAAKGGIIAATKALSREVAQRKVTVNAVAPGFIRTDMLEGMDTAELKGRIPARRLGEAEEVAAVVAFLASPEAGYVTGCVVTVDGGISA
ncbi:MAG: 3-oxoacyl-ACP reductase FabG [Bacteroidaceae bacterium]|jgi:3-oxoacyl-[acyl-carrier protein] reductase